MKIQSNSSKILHVDGDNFFVACEIARFPELKGKPVIVGEERGIASAMSYEAKALGVHRGMPVFEIREKFPQVVILPSHFELYEQYAEKLWQVLCRYSDCVERYSIDECFALISDSQIQSHKEETGEELLHTIKHDAEASLGITLSFGLADTKTLAKIGSKYNKPSGCVTIPETERIDFLKKTEIGKVWGIGRAISASLTSYNIKTAYDFIQLDNSFIKKNFGEGTLSTWHELRGTKILELETASRVPKSLQSTRSFGKSFSLICTNTSCTHKTSDPLHHIERSFFLSELSNHAESLCSRMRSYNLTTNKFSFFLKKKSQATQYISREIKLDFYTNNPGDICKAIYKACDEIFDELETVNLTHESQHMNSYENSYANSHADSYTDSYINPHANFSLRCKATGISVHQLKPHEAVQDDLFATQSTLDSKNQYNEAVDSLRKRFGDGTLYLCSSLESKKRRDKIFMQRNLKNKFVYGLPLPYMGEVN